MQIINATVFVQAINFGITYLFLRKILLKPIVQRIEQKDTAKSMLTKKLKEQEAFLLQLQNEKTENLERFRQGVKKFYTVDVTSEPQSSAVISYKKNAVHQEEVAELVTALLVKKVPYGY